MKPQVVHLPAKEIHFLRRQFEDLPEVSLFRSSPKLSAQIPSYGILREVGTINDELARFIFDPNS
ncbi:MAG: hypothetical protein L6Q37_03355 [Bdellovibrionaceae bacterium]|nr:hypothetical protein [Pseudobdellovibrionaceae bacterium]NUM57913.1 hypothetical protein [Pseudobdellovibrionaceae bacterium]